MTSRTTILLAVALLGGCGATDQTETSPPAPLCTTDSTGGTPVAKMAGTWTGSGTFQQTWKGKTTSVPVKVNLAFDEEGVPGTLPALGMISPWQTYPQGAPSLRATLERGGTAFAYCGFEADGSANLLDVRPVSRCGGPSAVEWRYRASYRFADLVEYELYDYSRPEAPQVAMEANDAFSLSTADGRETLTVRGRATGMTTTGQLVELHVDAQLVRGEQVYAYGCRLGHISPP